MPVLPDCSACGWPVTLQVDGDGAREVCEGCALAWRPHPVLGGILRAVRAIRLLGADAQPVLCRACDRGDHSKCWRVRCTCEHPEVS
jgi:hypothetical protein